MSEIEIRILGSLLEKERTTSEHYPLTTNALLLACNQKSNREPVVSYTLFELEEALQRLRDKGLVETARGDSERVPKHRHRLEDVFALDAKGFALLAVLMLRGKQTPGELRTRTERYVSFASLGEVEAGLQRLAEHQPPLAKNLGRGPGQSQERWHHTLGSDEERQRPRARLAKEARSELEELKGEVADLRAQVERLYRHLRLEPEAIER